MPDSFNVNPFLLDVRTAASKGLGVFTREPIPRGALVLNDRVVLVKIEDTRPGAAIEDYLIDWDDAHDAIAFGFCSLLNHAAEPNCRFEVSPAGPSLKLVALRDIHPDEELLVRYRCQLWFQPLP